MITLIICLIVALAGGITVFRQTHAIWNMTSTNACTINSTLNSVTIIEPILIILVIGGIIAVVSYTGRVGFGPNE